MVVKAKASWAEKENHGGIRAKVRDLAAGGAVEVGVLGPRAAAPHKGRDGELAEATIADIAFFHENGIGVPKRPWLSGWLNAEQSKIQDFTRKLAAQRVTGDLSSERALKMLAVFSKGAIQKYLVTGNFKPLSEITIARKRSSKPLIDTGQMRSSLDARVVAGGARGVLAQ